MRIEINLAPKEKRSTSGVPHRLSVPRFGSVPGKGILLILLLATWASVSGVAANRLEARREAVLTELHGEVADSLKLASRLAEFQELESERDAVSDRIGAIERLSARRGDLPRLLGEISGAMPMDAWLIELATIEPTDSLDSGSGLLLRGRARTPNGLTGLMRKLDDSRLIGGVTLVSTEQERMEGLIVQRFGIEARYRVPDPGSPSPPQSIGN